MTISNKALFLSISLLTMGVINGAQAADFPEQSLKDSFVEGSSLLKGFYVSGSIGSSTLDHTIERNIGAGVVLPAPDSSGVSSVEETDFSGGLAIGYQRHFYNNFYIGIEGFYNFENTSSRNINGVLVTDIDLEASYGGRLILGADITDRFSIYVHGGATVLDFDINNSYTFAPPRRSRGETEVGFSYGVGVNYKIADQWSVFADYTRIEDVDFNGIPEVAGGTGRVNPNELDLDKISLGIKYSF